MITRCNLPDSIRLPSGQILKPVIGGHLNQKPFITEIDVTQNGWAGRITDPDIERGERTLIIREAKKQKLKYRLVSVLGRNLRGKNDLHHRPYTGTKWVFVEVKGVQ